MMMILWISFVFDAMLIIYIAAKAKNIKAPSRFVAFSSIINLFAYYIACGLNTAFGVNLLFDVICTITAKIFVVCAYYFFRQRKTSQSFIVYIIVITISLCVHTIPLIGIISELVLLVYLLRFEYSNIKNTGKSDVSVKQDNAAALLNENGVYLRTIEENYRKTRALWHDLNNHIICMRSLIEDKQYDELEIYVNALSEKIASGVFPVKSGNIVLDALMADKYQKARKADIYVEFENINYHNAIDAEDLGIIIGNLFDNAIEENLRSPNKETRFIKIYMTSIDDTLVIRFKNPLLHDLTVKSGLPFTTKPNTVHHGIGLKNVRRVCDKYNGELLWSSENGIFEITARLILT